jgi:cation diffusion facilitator family transporter
MMFSSKGGAARLALFVVIGLIAVKIVVAVITGSISITAQALDSFLDLFAIGIALFAVRFSGVPADEEHPFGHGKIEGIAAWVQAGLIFLAAAMIIYSAVLRIIEGTTIKLAEAGIGVMLLSIVVSILLSRHLLRVSKSESSLALEGLARNIAADVYSASGVLVSLVVLRFTGFGIIDPIVAMVVALFILKSGYDVLRRSFAELVDVRLPKEEEDEVISCLMEYRDQFAGFHAIRTRKAGSQRFIDLHLVVPKEARVEEAHELCDHLEIEIAQRLHDSSVTIHVEPCDENCEHCLVLSCDLRRT